MSIPVENIYYLLCYAWDKLEEKDRVPVSIDDRTKLIDLLAKVLINSTRILLKRGIDRSYVEITTEFAGVKGKLELSETIKRQLLFKQKSVCSFDEFSANILTNRILVTTLNRLLRFKDLDRELRSEIKSLLWRFGEIELIDLKNSTFSGIRLHRNNKFYGLVLNVCQLIYENSLLSEKDGSLHFSDFLRDERKMGQLFEAFLRNFYRIEQKEFKVRRENIEWQFSSDSLEHSRFLPRMQTDITLESQTAKIIIDAKFYKETLQTNYSTEKVSSGNLYQLFSYLLNQQTGDPRTHTATGILIYPRIERDYDLQFRYQRHDILIKTVDLNSSWRDIDKRLKEIIRLKA
jgi:5-methylcytosine-specific restriction enzyme subunit McrC